jgi:hypothetical protein
MVVELSAAFALFFQREAVLPNPLRRCAAHVALRGPLGLRRLCVAAEILGGRDIFKMKKLSPVQFGVIRRSMNET